MPKDIQEIIKEMYMMPLVGSVTLKGKYLRRLLDYITELEAKNHD